MFARKSLCAVTLGASLLLSVPAIAGDQAQQQTGYPADAVPYQGALPPIFQDSDSIKWLYDQRQKAAKAKADYCKEPYADAIDCAVKVQKDTASDEKKDPGKDKTAYPPLQVKSIIGVAPAFKAEIMSGGGPKMIVMANSQLPDGRSIRAVVQNGIILNTGEFIPY